MSVALGRLAEEDPTFQVQTNEETGQTEISGMGELHLEILVDRMKREFNVEANVGKPAGLLPRDHPRHAPRRSRARFVRQTGGSGQYGIVYIDIEPAPGRGLRVRLEDQGRLGPDASSSPRSRRASRRRWDRRQGRLPDGRRAASR